MSDSNRMQLSYGEESTFKTSPTGSYSVVRYTAESLRQDTQTTQSQEVRSDRQIADIIRTGITAVGDVSIELSYGAHDDLLEGAFFTDWTAGGGASASGTTISVSSGSLQDSANGFGGFTGGDLIRVSGFTGAAAVNNGVHVVNTALAGVVTVVGSFPADVGAGDTVTVEECDDILVNGVTFHHYTFEKAFLDLTNKFQLYPGCTVETFSLSVTPQAVLTGGFSFLGGYGSSVSSSPGSGYSAAPTNSVLNAIDDITGVVEGSDRIGITNFSLQLQNNLRQRLQVATLGPISIGSGTIAVSGTVQAYFEDETLIDKYLNFTTSSLIVGFSDSAGNNYLLHLPSIKYTNGQTVSQGINQDVIADLQFEAKIDPTLTKTIRLGRWAA